MVNTETKGKGMCRLCFTSQELDSDGLIDDHLRALVLLELTHFGPSTAVKVSKCPGSGKPPLGDNDYLRWGLKYIEKNYTNQPWKPWRSYGHGGVRYLNPNDGPHATEEGAS
jgi:hypothetical protein